MFDSAGKRSGVAGSASATSATPGKQTLVERTHPAVQQRAAPAEAGAGDESAIHAAAARGVATPASPLPHGATIQHLFGRHDISGVKAHVGGPAAASARAMGADAYATGDHVVLGDKGSDLFTVAHEAAHVVQQRGGVQLRGGVGAVGDHYERHADEVASHVVQGKSAEALLDRYAGGGHGAAAGPVQRRVTVGAQALGQLNDVQAAWAQISQFPMVQEVDPHMAEAVLRRWITRPIVDRNNPDITVETEDRRYQSWEELARAVAGEVSSDANLGHERRLADETLSAAAVAAGVHSFTQKLLNFHEVHRAHLRSAEQRGARYAGWTYGQVGDSVGDGLRAPPQDLQGQIAFIADYALGAKYRAFEAIGQTQEDSHATMDQGVTPELMAARAGHHNTAESSPWVQKAREHQSPLSAGPSATTGQVLTLATAVGATLQEKQALAWALFGIWNKMPTNRSGTHRFHEVMVVAKAYGVPYIDFEYSAHP